MINTKELVSTFSIPEKIALLRDLYNDITGYGEEGDTELAHVNIFEAGVLKSLGGSGTINEVTGLREYKGGGGGGQQQQPAVTSTTQTAEFPPELRPHIERITGEAETEYDVARDEGFIPFGGPQIAGFRPEQLQAQELGRQQFGTGLAGTALGDPSTYYQPALGAGLQGVTDITSEQIQERINPFQQNVIDIATREAQRQADVERQRINAEAVGQGAFGGSRAGVQQAEASRNLQQNLADIQARGLYGGYDRAVTSLENERRRQLTGAQQLGTLGEIAADRSRKQIAGLAGIGEVQQAQRQQALDLARQQFEQERFFPKGELQQYQSIIRGLPQSAGFTQVQRQPIIQTPLSSQLLGAGLAGLNIYGQSGGFGARKTGGQVGSFANGGIVSLQRGTLEEAMDVERSGLGEAIEEKGGMPSWRDIIEMMGRLQGAGASPFSGTNVSTADVHEQKIPVTGVYEEQEQEEVEVMDEPIPYFPTREKATTEELPSSYPGSFSPPFTNLEKYQNLLKGYKGAQDKWTTGFGGASQAHARLVEGARSARGGLGAFNQPTILEQLTAAMGGAGEALRQRAESEQARKLATTKELADIDAQQAKAAEDRRQFELKHGLREREVTAAEAEAGAPAKFAPTASMNKQLATYYGRKLTDFATDNNEDIVDFGHRINSVASALNDNPRFNDRNQFDKGSKAAELVSLAWDPKQRMWNPDIYETILLSAQHAAAGTVDETFNVPPLIIIENFAKKAQDKYPNDPEAQSEHFFGLMLQAFRSLDVDIHGKAPVDTEGNPIGP